MVTCVENDRRGLYVWVIGGSVDFLGVEADDACGEAWIFVGQSLVDI